MSEPANNGTVKTAPLALSERVRSLRLPDTDEAPPTRMGWLPWAICAVLVVVTAFFALEAFSPIDDELVKKLAAERGLTIRKDGTPTALTSPGTPTALKGTTSDIALESKGYIVPISLIQVSPKISGTVMKLYIKEGMEVTTDNFLLAELEDVEYRSDKNRAEGLVRAAQARYDELYAYRAKEIEQTKAELDDAIAQREQALAKFIRAKRLKETTSVSPEEYESSQSNYLSSEQRVVRTRLTYELLREGPRDAKIAAAAAEVSQARADHAKARWRFDNTKVYAPIKGVILSKKTEEGNIVNPSAFSNGLSASLCEMANLHELEVDLSIAEREIAKVFQGQECRIRAEAFPERIYTGKVSRIMPMGDRGKMSVPVRVLIDFPARDAKGNVLPKDRQGEYLRPEMGAIVTFMSRKAG